MEKSITEYVKALIAAAEGEAVQRPYEVLERVYAEDADKLNDVIRASSRAWSMHPSLFRDVLEMVYEHPNELRGTLASTLRSRQIDLERRLEAATLLVQLGCHEFRSAIVEDFNRLCRQIEHGSAPLNTDIASRIFEVCILCLTETKDALVSLSRAGMGALDFTGRCLLNAAIIMFNRGAEGLLQKLNEEKDPTGSHWLIFALACCGRPDQVNILRNCYMERQGWADFDVRLACVEGMVYAGTPEAINDFLVSSLKHQLSRGTLKSKGFDADLGLLVNAGAWSPIFSNDLAKLICEVAHAKHPRLAAMAVTVCRMRNSPCAGEDEVSEQFVMRVREELRGRPSPMMLMYLRRAKSRWTSSEPAA